MALTAAEVAENLFEKCFSAEHKMFHVARATKILEEWAAQLQPKTDNDGVLIYGVDLPLGNGWKFRYKEIVGECLVQLIDRNGCPLLEGFMMEPEVAAAEFQPHPDENDEAVARKLINECITLNGLPCSGVRVDISKEGLDLIARHTAAKVAAAEERGWNMGAEAMLDVASKALNDNANTVRKRGDRPQVERNFIADRYGNQAKAIRALPIPLYQNKVK